MAIRHFKLAINDIILLVEDLGVEKTFHDDLGKQNFGELRTFKNWIFRDLICNPEFSLNFISICEDIAFRYESLNLYVSHYDSDSSLLANSILKPKNIFLMDEGTASFETVIARRANRDTTPSLTIKSLLYKLRIYLPLKITYFTKYNLEANLLDSVELYSDKLIHNTLFAKDMDVIFLLGSSAVEVGLIRKTHYLDILKIIRSDNVDKSIHYYAHRKESPKKLKEIGNIGFEIILNELPFETLFANLRKMPHKIISIHISGVLDNISKRYQNIPELVMYKFNDALLLKNRDVYRDIYNHFKKNEKLFHKEI